MYSRLLEAYLAAARPDLQVECRQYGWSGETAGGFFGRMKNDVLRFQPTIASTCYGMNDFRYVPFEKSIGEDYRKNQTKVVQAFKAAGARVVLGSSGTIHSVPPWVKSARGTWETLNLALLQFRNINIEVAEAEQVAFADVYWPMLAKGYATRAKYGDSFKLEGGDGVHPGWSGHVIMAAAYLKALGLDGNLGMVEVDLAARTAQGSAGQRVVPGQGGALTLISDGRLPSALQPSDAEGEGRPDRPAQGDVGRSGEGLRSRRLGGGGEPRLRVPPRPTQAGLRQDLEGRRREAGLRDPANQDALPQP
jgi:lysophospholipase L1-like esterase